MITEFTLKSALLWMVIWFAFVLAYSLADTLVWKKLSPSLGRRLNIGTTIVSMAAYLYLLITVNRLQFQPWRNLSFHALLHGLICGVLLYFLLNRAFLPLLSSFFQDSAENYRNSMDALCQASPLQLLLLLVLAPIMEEIMMRHLYIDGLSAVYGTAGAVLISAFLFSFLHFNMIQALLALLMGLILGLLYQKTSSLCCCIAAHMGYNFISFAALSWRRRIKEKGAAQQDAAPVNERRL